MDWNFSSEYFKKELYGEEYNCLKLSVVKMEKVIDSNLDNENNLEVQNTVPKETNSINLLIKKTTDGNVYILSDNTIIDNITKIISKINPMMVFMVQMFIPMFKPLQLKLDIGNLKVLELFINKKKIDVSDFGDLSFNNNELNKLSSMEIMNSLMGNNSLFNHNDDENKDEDEDESTKEDSTTDESEKSDDVNSDENEINSKFDELINKLRNSETNELFKQLGGIDMNNLGNLLCGLGGLNTTEQNKSSEQTQPQFNISNLTNNIENIWKDKYYDDENLDDFLMDDDNKHEQEGDKEEYDDETNDLDDNLTRYLKLNPEEISIEISLINLNDYSNIRENIKMLTSREMYNKQIKIYQSSNDENLSSSQMPQMSQLPQFPGMVGSKKWVGKDENGDPCLYYSFGNLETKHFAYKHLAQLEKILLELVDTIQQM